MADVSPGAYTTYGDPLRVIPAMLAGTAPSNGTPAFLNYESLVHRVFYFDDVDTGDTWTSGIPGIVALAWSNDFSNDADFCSARLTTLATGVITFTVLGTDAADAQGFLHVWSRG